MVKDWTCEERQAMRDAVPRLAFKTPFRDTNVGELAKQMIEISADGLRRRAQHDSIGTTEEGFLSSLREMATRGYTRAEELLDHYRNSWGGDIRPIFKEYNFL
jgi:glutamate--cysteine ligase